jgi:hypothetical protein
MWWCGHLSAGCTMQDMFPRHQATQWRKLGWLMSLVRFMSHAHEWDKHAQLARSVGTKLLDQKQ